MEINDKEAEEGRHGLHCIKLFGVSIWAKGEEPFNNNIDNDNDTTTSIRTALISSNTDSSAGDYSTDNQAAADLDHDHRHISSTRRHANNKGRAWSEEEHLMFLKGLKALGRGNWKKISRMFVTSRTPSQVASHAQKYFLRQAPPDSRKRRSSLFDITLEQNLSVRTPPQDSKEAQVDKNMNQHSYMYNPLIYPRVAACGVSSDSYKINPYMVRVVPGVAPGFQTGTNNPAVPFLELRNSRPVYNGRLLFHGKFHQASSSLKLESPKSTQKPSV